MNISSLLLFLLHFSFCFTKTISSVELLVNPSFEDSPDNQAFDWKMYDGEMPYDIICTNQVWSCAAAMKKYDVKPFYGYWFVLTSGITNYTYSSMVFQYITTDVDINRAETTSLYLQFWYSSSGSSNSFYNLDNLSNNSNSTCNPPEIHVYLGGQHLYAGITNVSHNYTFVNASVYQNWMSVESGMEFMFELLLPDPNCDYLPYLAVDNITLTWNYQHKNLFTENVLLIVIMCCIIIVSCAAAFFLIRRDNVRKRRNLMDVPVFPSCDWLRYCSRACKKENYELVH